MGKRRRNTEHRVTRKNLARRIAIYQQRIMPHGLNVERRVGRISIIVCVAGFSQPQLAAMSKEDASFISMIVVEIFPGPHSDYRSRRIHTVAKDNDAALIKQC